MINIFSWNWVCGTRSSGAQEMATVDKTPKNVTPELRDPDSAQEGSIGRYLRKNRRRTYFQTSSRRGKNSEKKFVRDQSDTCSPLCRIKDLKIGDNTPANDNMTPGFQATKQEDLGLEGTMERFLKIKKRRLPFTEGAPAKRRSISAIDVQFSSKIVSTPKGTPVQTQAEPEDNIENKKFELNPVDNAIGKALENPNLIGDFSKECLLPTVVGKHPDMKSISPSTMARILDGEFEEKFLVIDCRYPYEYKGGHIKGAENYYIKKQLSHRVFSKHMLSQSTERPILIFHCEFSAERGPNMYRYVRGKDRQLNGESYPSLFYPEMYLLEGGYKSFFMQFKEHCDPMSYKTMRDNENAEDMVNCRKLRKREGGQSNKYDHGKIRTKLQFSPYAEVK